MTPTTELSSIQVPRDHESVAMLWAAYNLVGRQASNIQGSAEADDDGQLPLVSELQSYRLLMLHTLVAHQEPEILSVKCYLMITNRDGKIDGDLYDRAWSGICELMEIVGRFDQEALSDLLSRWVVEG